VLGADAGFQRASCVRCACAAPVLMCRCLDLVWLFSCTLYMCTICGSEISCGELTIFRIAMAGKVWLCLLFPKPDAPVHTVFHACSAFIKDHNTQYVHTMEENTVTPYYVVCGPGLRVVSHPNRVFCPPELVKVPAELVQIFNAGNKSENPIEDASQIGNTSAVCRCGGPFFL
jgi:hypothetical protein